MALERPNELVCPRKEEASPEERMIYQVLRFYIMTTHSLGYGVMVNITVSHTVAPGSIPGTRKHFRLLFLFFCPVLESGRADLLEILPAFGI